MDLRQEQLKDFATLNFQEALARIEQQEDGGMIQRFMTEVLLEYLCDAGETENTLTCTYIKPDKLGRKLMKVDGYAIDEGYETLDLFVSYYQQSGDVYRAPKQEILRAGNLARKYLNSTLKGYLQDIEESAEVFELTQLIWKQRKKLIRVNIFILSDGVADVSPRPEEMIDDVMIKYHIWDLERFFKLHQSTSKREPIEINFKEQFGKSVPCLSMPRENEHYQTYMAILPGHVLAQLYQIYGARLLESNVRAFLQNTGKINRGIRDTIQNEPQMFLAYNNGISATAEMVTTESTDGKTSIKSIIDFQVVNGGQTTASIFHTHRKYKSDVSQVFVQMKLTVVKDPDQATRIVPLISRYANSQNKISEADLSSNHEFHIQMQKLSRVTFAPANNGSNQQTRWFFERVRGQYREEKNREGTPTRKRAFDMQNPRSQMFTKTDIAKYMQTWNCHPQLVTRGAQKNYVEFMKGLKGGLPGKVFFEDLIAKAILFKSAEKIYGTGPRAIGDLNRFLIVPYALSWLSSFTEHRMDLAKIWKNQRISPEFESIVRETLVAVNTFMHEKAPGGLITEWAKKEECWNILKSYKLPVEFELKDISGDLASQAAITQRAKTEQIDLNEELIHRDLKLLQAIPYEVWQKIEAWGRISGHLSPYLQGIANNIGKKVLRKRMIIENERIQGLKILELTEEKSPQLLQFNEKDIPSMQEESVPVSQKQEITLELLKKVLDWEKRHKKLSNWDFKLLKECIAANADLSEARQKRVHTILQAVKKYGFSEK